MSDEDHGYTVPSSEADRKAITDALHEMCGALQFIEDKREFMKDVAAVLKEKYEIPPKISAALARTLHKCNYADVSAEKDQYSTLFETLFQKEV